MQSLQIKIIKHSIQVHIFETDLQSKSVSTETGTLTGSKKYKQFKIKDHYKNILCVFFSYRHSKNWSKTRDKNEDVIKGLKSRIVYN